MIARQNPDHTELYARVSLLGGIGGHVTDDCGTPRIWGGAVAGNGRLLSATELTNEAISHTFRHF